MKNKFIIGITGLPGTGKTEVLKVMEEEGFFTIEGDKIAHEIFNEQRKKIEEIFNRKDITRKEVAEIIFKDRKKREEFENFIHPLILERIFERVRNSESIFIAVEGTLLFELNTQDRFDLVITVASDLGEIYKRMINKGFSEEMVMGMIERGLSQDEKIRRADICIDNRGSVDELRKKVRRLCRIIKRE